MKRTVFLVALVAVAGCELFKGPTDPAPPAANEVNYTAIGASDAIGFGGSIPCIPFTACPNGTGYVSTLVRRLEADKKAVKLVNLGLPGAVLAPEVEAMGDALGRGIPGNFLERELPFVPRDSTLVTIFAGGNDVNTVGDAAQSGLGGSDINTFLTTQIQNFGRDMRTLVSGILDRAPTARIVALNLPNMGALPYAGGFSTLQKRGLQEISVGFSARINSLVSEGVIVIDLMCDSRMYEAGMYSGDGFHPNDTGYAYLAELAYQAAITLAPVAPRSSCPQMAIF